MLNEVVELKRNGRVVYAIQNKETGLFYIRVYSNRITAREMAVREKRPINKKNWRQPGQTLIMSNRVSL